MPAATPLPGRPAALVLGSAEVLLGGAGCAVCRHTAEASGRYLSWFALEAHADPATCDQLCASLGMCPGHTRALIRQPGAARRLTPVYWHIMRAVPARFGARRPRLAPCPACEHDQAAARRAAGIIADWLADGEQDGMAGSVLSRLCLPHARVIATAAGPRVSRRLPQASAGHAAAAGITGTDRAGEHLCPRHLRDAVAMHPGVRSRLLAAEHARQNEELRRLTTRPRWRYHRGRGRQGARLMPVTCPACQASGHAIQQEMERHRVLLTGSAPDPGDGPGLCAHHVLSLRAAAPAAGRIAAAQATEQARSLIAELAEAFGENTWMRRHAAQGPETTAWLRAAVFLDGRVFGGGPPPKTPRRGHGTGDEIR